MDNIKKLSWLVVIAGLIYLFWANPGYSGIEVPFYAGVKAKPNVLILLDTSGSMAWCAGSSSTCQKPNRRIDIAQRVMTGSGRQPVIYNNNQVYMGKDTGEFSLYDELAGKNVFVKILLVHENQTTGALELTTVDYYRNNLGLEPFYFTAMDSVDKQFPNSAIESATYDLNKFMIENKANYAETMYYYDIDGDTDGLTGEHLREIFRPSWGSGTPFRTLFMELKRRNEELTNLPIVRVTYVNNCYWQWTWWGWVQRPCYEPAPVPVGVEEGCFDGDPGTPCPDDPYNADIPGGQGLYFMWADEIDFASENPDMQRATWDFATYVFYTKWRLGSSFDNYNSYSDGAATDLTVCGDGPLYTQCPNDGRDTRKVFKLVPDGTSGSVYFGAWTEDDIINRIINEIPEVAKVDAYGPGGTLDNPNPPDGVVGPEFIKVIGSLTPTRMDEVIREGLDWWRIIQSPPLARIYEPYSRTLTTDCLDTPYLCNFFGYENEDGDSVFTGLPYTALGKESAGIMDTYDARYGLMIFDSNYSGTGDLDFPNEGGNLIYNLSEGATHNLYLQEILAQADQNGDGKIADGNSKWNISLLRTPSGGTPITSMLRDAFSYMYDWNFATNDFRASTYDTNPSMFNHWDPTKFSATASFNRNGHIVLNDPYYIYQCRTNNVIYLTDGGQTTGIPYERTYYEISPYVRYRCSDTLWRLAPTMQAQQTYVGYFANPGAVNATKLGTSPHTDFACGSKFCPAKVYFIGFSILTSTACADMRALEMMNGMASASNLEYGVGWEKDVTTPFWANSEIDLISTLNVIMAMIMEGTYTVSAPTLSVDLKGGVAGYFEIKGDDYLWHGHLVFGDLTSMQDLQTDSANIEPSGDAATWLNDILSSSTSPRQIFTSKYNSASSEWERVEFTTSNSGILADYLFPGYPTYLELFDQDGNGALDMTDVSLVINFVHGISGSTYRDQKQKQWNLGAIYHSTPKAVGAPPAPSDVFGVKPKETEETTDEKTYKAFYAEHINAPQMAYVGALDGMLHAFIFEDPDGDGPRQVLEEAFAYIPNALLSKLFYLRNGEQQSYVDGDPAIGGMRTSWPEEPYPSEFSCNKDEKWCWRLNLFCGLKDGGNAYFSLDITDASTVEGGGGDDVKVRWEFTDPYDETAPTESALGRSWSSPWMDQVKYLPEDSTTIETTVVMVVGGGVSPDKRAYEGSWLYMVDADVGAQFATFMVPGINQKCEVAPGGILNHLNYRSKCTLTKKIKGKDTHLNKNQVPGDAKGIDINGDAYLDWLYFGDIQGRVWKINTSSLDQNEWKMCLFFDTGDKGYDNLANPVAQCNGDLRSYDVDGSTGALIQPGCVNPDKRKPVYYRPYITPAPRGSGWLIFVGTSHTEDKTELLDETQRNYVFALLDSDTLSQCSYAKIWQGTPMLVDGKQKAGWPIQLGPNEKLISAPKVAPPESSPFAYDYTSEVSFISYNPIYAGLNPCQPGVSFIWRVDYDTGRGAYAVTEGARGRFEMIEGMVSSTTLGNISLTYTGEFEATENPIERFLGFYYWWIR